MTEDEPVMALPSLLPEAAGFLEQAGLTGELDAVLDHATATVLSLNEGLTMLSPNPAIHVLALMSQHEGTEALYLARLDTSSGFWSQAHRRDYLRELRASMLAGTPRHRRLLIYDDADADLLPAPLIAELRELHTRGTLISLPRSALVSYGLLFDLKFGFVLSRSTGCVVIPVPADYPPPPSDRDIASVVEDLKDREHDARDGPLRALITGATGYVAALSSAFRAATEDPAHTTLR